MGKQYEGPRPKRRANPDNKNAVGRCENREQGRRCDLRKGHGGGHVPRTMNAGRKNGH